ncbi:hypothetical protein BG011_001863 [Mortierella polycephala]|uniref:Vacuole protein n=1 Tax=Mortierella polycephala TaxID=41804 RepID=A0A9P6U5S1_9FUNG|nr:hypothetical protein BG011_001863 [Mortierella polycephala]
MGAQWKREVVQDHKFDFINVDDFIDNSCWRQFTYSLVFAAIIRGILVYCSDIFTAANLLANSNANSFVPKTGVELQLFGELPFEVYKWLFSGCILLGFLLLGLDIRRARAIIISRDISYAFTSLIASRYYTVRSYPHYCFFSQINNSKKMVDDIAFFCFFTFRNWKRLMLADAPRQVINATILYQTFQGHFNSTFFDWDDIVGEGNIYKKISLGAMLFTVFMFALSLIMLIAAVILYIPLVSHIQGNLKEYCCHKIDKRIDGLIRKKSKTRAADEAGKNRKDAALVNMKQPTLPQVDILEAPVVPVGTPRSAYAQKTPQSGYNYAPVQQSSKEYGYPPRGAHNKNVAHPSQQPLPQSQQKQQQQQQYQQHEYDYYHAKSQPSLVPSASGKPTDPYAESAFVSDDGRGRYGGRPDQQSLHHDRSGPGQGGDNYGGVYTNTNSGAGANYYSTSPYVAQNPPRPGRYEDYGHRRPSSPIQSQHGSELESHHSSSMGPTYGAGTGAGYGNTAPHSNARYGQSGVRPNGNEYPPNGRRQDTGQPRNAYRGGGGGGRGGPVGH